MSISPVAALRKAMRTALMADATLTGKLGEARIYDEAPRGAPTPYLTFGDISTRDWSTSSDTGAEHVVLIHVWSTQRGLREALDISADVQRLLNDAALTLDSHRLVGVRQTTMESRRDNNGRFERVSLRFRAVTEAI